MTRIATTAALLLGTALPALAQGQAPKPATAIDDQWHFTLAPYLWTPGISGDVSIAHLSVPVDTPFSDIWDNLDFALQGHFEARKNRFGLGFDFVYTNLGVPTAPNSQVLDYNVDVRQLFTEGLFFYRAASGGRTDNPAHLDVLAGLRYTGTRTRLSAEDAAGGELDGESVDLSWVDALAGVRFRAPLGSRAALIGRADVAGFGSNVTWNLEGDLAFLASERWTLGVGWRYMDFDYDNGEQGLEFREFDLAYSGPRFWFAYSW